MDNQLKKKSYNSEERQRAELLALMYDLTPSNYLSMIVCEIGNIPPHSVPVVIREIMMDTEEEIMK